MKLWQLKEVLAAAGVPQLAALARECLYLKSSRTTQRKLALGESRLGGYPDLPPDFTWPRYFDVPLPLLAQLNMEEIARDCPLSLLPPKGWLLFFGSCCAYPAEADSSGGFPFRVVLLDSEKEALSTTQPPRPAARRGKSLFARLFARSEDPEEEYSPCSVRWSREWDAPLGEDIGLKQVELVELLEPVWEIVATERGNLPCHKMLGWPEPIQCTVLGQTQDEWGMILPGSGDEWELLLQLESDPEPDFLWGDAGTMYFMIRRDDLLAGRLDKCVCTTQCH